jgi:alanyl-tRNA synthetase
MTAQDIRKAYLKFFEQREHKLIPRALLVPQNDPTTLFTGSGMQPLIPNLLGEPHPDGVRLVDSQTCLRAQDIEEVGDNRHTTFFEMLGNWSFGDYFKAEQLPWFFEFLTEVVGLEPKNLYVTCFTGDTASDIPKDTESADVWRKLFEKAGVEAREVEIGSEQDGYEKGMRGGRIFFYDASKNWWSRSGVPASMPAGEPGGPDSEVFYDFGTPHDERYGKECHPNCDCGRFLEIGNSVFMEYIKTESGFDHLPKRNVDFGGGLERIAAASLHDPDIFKISLLKPIIEKLEQLSGKNYDSHTESMRVIADHLRAATFLAVDGVVPSNKEQGYVMRRLMRRAIRFAFELGVEQNFMEQIVPVVADLYHDDFPELAAKRNEVIAVLVKEEKAFRQTLRQGQKELDKMLQESNDTDTDGRKLLSGGNVFKLYDTFGYPKELTAEVVAIRGDALLSENWMQEFDVAMQEQRERSRTATKGEFKGGLADHSEITTKYHTATHLMYKALRIVLGDHVVQRGSNITADRLRFDFSHPDKLTSEQIAEVEKIVNENIAKDWPMGWKEMNTKEALAQGVLGAFGDKYGETVKVYTAGDPDGEWFSKEICGGPHVEHTGQLAEGGKLFKITKEESSSAGVRRIKAVLV